MRVWPATLRARISASLALVCVLLFLVIYVVTAAITGFDLWPSGDDALLKTLVPLGVAGLALVVGFSLGQIVTRVVRVPLERFIERVQNNGLAAIEGRAVDPAPRDPDLPLELQALEDTVDQLLMQLSERQAELRDVTERALDSEQTFRTVVNASSEVKLLLRDDIVEVANPAAAGFLGIPLGILLGKPLADALQSFAITTESGDPLSAAMLLEHVGEQETLVHCLGEDGTERWAECSVTHPHEDHALALLTVHDVTERRTLEQLRAEVVSVVSHDLRAPLTVVSGYLEMLATDMDAEKRATVVSRARTATARMAEMLEDLLDTARAGTGLRSDRRAPVNLAELASDVASSLPSHPGHELVIEPRADVVAPGDAGRLRQALTNLLMNAFKHTPTGTTISLVVDAGDSVGLLIVEDGGSGVPEEHREHIFERYTRLSDTPGDGAGLGLYIVKTVAEGHGGRAYVEDGDGGGARFVIELPLRGQDS